MKIHRLRFVSLSLLLAILSVAGCTGFPDHVTRNEVQEVEDLRVIQPVGSPFTQQLTYRYREFSIREHDILFDYPDAVHFARKGLASAAGQNVLPEPITDWDIDLRHLKKFIEARSRLMRLLDIGARELHPNISAKAQVSYDCWLEQQEENWQENDIQSCKRVFFEALEKLETALASETIPSDVIGGRTPPKIPFEPINPDRAQIITAQDLPATASRPLTPSITKYLAFFDFDSATLSPGAREVLREVAKEVQNNPNLQNMTIIGHADTSGSEQYNKNLAHNRAINAEKELIRMGLHEGQIRTKSLGETSLLIPTRDNVREPANRRIEIIFE